MGKYRRVRDVEELVVPRKSIPWMHKHGFGPYRVGQRCGLWVVTRIDIKGVWAVDLVLHPKHAVATVRPRATRATAAR